LSLIAGSNPAAANQPTLSPEAQVFCPTYNGARIGEDVAMKCAAFLASRHEMDVTSQAIALQRLALLYYAIDQVSRQRTEVSARRTLEALDRAIALQPQNGQLHVMKAGILESHDLNAATRAYDKGMELATSDWRVYAGKARFKLWHSNKAVAEQLSRKSIELAPRSPYAHSWHGQLLENLGKFDEALVSYRFAHLNEDGRDESNLGMFGVELAQLSYARMLQRTGDPEECIKILSDFIENKRSPVWKYQIESRASCYEDAKKYEQAAKDYELAASIYGASRDPDELKLKSAMARAKTSSGEEAVEDVWTVLERANLRQILQVQVFLRNNGFDDVNINGKRDEALKNALSKCALESKCKNGLKDTI
jgi:tetratricopeptide (TPR) repeat protein